jgi:DNA replication protein DnaC
MSRDEDETGGYGSLESWVRNGRACPKCKRPQDGGWLCDECAKADRQREINHAVDQRLANISRSLPPALAKFANSAEARGVLRSKKLLALGDRYEPAHGNLCIVGPSGAGKTVAMLVAVLRLMKNASSKGDKTHPICGSFWTSGLGLARALREQRLGSECQELEQARHCRLLFLDEIGQEMADPRWLIELLDSRYCNGGITLTTSGLRKSELEARYGMGATRRFTEPDGSTFDLFGDGA